MEITRRKFMQGIAAGGAALTIGAGLAGCAQGKGAESGASNEASSSTAEVSGTFEADVVVAGAGMSGLSAAVSAAESGAKVICIEAGDVTGGNGQGTEGVFGCGSALQKAAGIDFTLSDVIAKELAFFNYRIDALRWKDLVSATAGNIDWLMEQGVAFGAVDNYHNQGQLDGFHWFEDGSLKSYIEPMTQRAEELGVEFKMRTRALEIVMDSGSVSGIRAKTEDGSTIQVNCKAVILATGGYADSDEKLAEMGVDTSVIVRKGFEHHEGDGIDMATAVGGVDTRRNHCIMREPGVADYPFETPLGAMGVRNGGPFMFVNGQGERYTNEGCITGNQAHAANCVLTQKKFFAVINDECLQWVDENATQGIYAAAEDAINVGAKAYKAETVEELAEAIGIDAETLAGSLKQYNAFCANGTDEDFGKDPSMLLPMEEGPYWAFQHGLFYFSTIGGIATNRQFEVVDEKDEPIAGLYAVGTDGCELYRETYTVMVPASCNANNVNSGRVAGSEAAAYCGASK